MNFSQTASKENFSFFLTSSFKMPRLMSGHDFKTVNTLLLTYPYTPSYGLNSITIVLIKGWIWHYITHEGWYAMPFNKETKTNPYIQIQSMVNALPFFSPLVTFHFVCMKLLIVPFPLLSFIMVLFYFLSFLFSPHIFTPISNILTESCLSIPLFQLLPSDV